MGATTASTVSMKKKLSYGSQQQARGGRWRTGGITSLIVVILLVILMLPTIIPGPGHHHHDQQQGAQSVLQISTVNRASKTQAPKVAFLFLARNQMPLDFLWEHFFQVREMPCRFIIIVFHYIQWRSSNWVLSELWLF